MALPWPPIDDQVRAAVARQLETTVSIYDRSGIIARFEDAFARRHSAEHPLLTSSGTAALHSAYYGLGLGPGDEVLVQDYTFFATAMPLFQLGAAPVPIDVDAGGALDLSKAEEQLTPTTKALVAIHMWGQPQPMRPLRDFCDHHGLVLIEDCSHAHGASREGTSVGQLADTACWSLQGNKTITAGEGGILTTPHRDLYERATLLGHFNKRALGEIDTASPLRRYAETGLGLKYRAHPLGLAMAEIYLNRLDTWLATRRRHAAALESALAAQPGITVLTPTTDVTTPTLYAFVFTVDPERSGYTRDDLLHALTEAGCQEVRDCEAMRPLHTYPAFTHPRSPVTRYSTPLLRGDFTQSERLRSQAVRITVPSHDDPATHDYIREIIRALQTALTRLS